MVVDEFYNQRACQKLYEIEKQHIQRDDKHNQVMQKLIFKVCAYLKEHGKDGPPQAVYNAISEFVQTEILSYADSWFEFDFQKKEAQEKDFLMMMRFVKWFLDAGYTVVDTKCSCSIPFKASPDGTLESVATMVCELPGRKYEAFFLQYAKLKKGLRGRSAETNLKQDLGVMCTKLCMENTFPGIAISVNSLKNENDDCGVGEKYITGVSPGSNRIVVEYDDYYSSDGDFLSDDFYDMLNDLADLPVKANCATCSGKTLCQTKTLRSIVRAGEKKEYLYSIPSFTQTQEQAVNHENGPALICAGPGSGKTAVVIGRIHRLIQKGVPPQFILVITFSKEATNELKKRCASFLHEDDMPMISTIHSFCAKVLKENGNREEQTRMLTKPARMMLLHTIQNAMPRLQGFKDGKIFGSNGLLETIAGRIDRYYADGEEAFFQKYPDISKEQFHELLRLYENIISDRSYATFDELITKTIRLFEEKPEVLENYQRIYKFVMVDEFQDVNENESRLVDLLSAAHKNVMVVGDDDQNIYAFRGGSSAYMLDFPKRYPDAKVVVLRDNFRSTSELVSLTGEQIYNGVKERYAKELVAHTRGALAKIVPDNSVYTVETIIQYCLEKGYSFSDIVVLAKKNATLDIVHEKMVYPSILAKSYIRQDALFLVIYDLLCIVNGYETEFAKAQLCAVLEWPLNSLQGVDIMRYDGEEPLPHFLALLANKISSVSSSKDILQYVAESLDVADSVSKEAIENLINDGYLMTTNELFEYMKYMCLFEDDSRLKYESSDAVTLSTSHDSKGQEFAVVIIVDADDYRRGEEDAHLLYVAMTRAKKDLFLCTTEQTYISGLNNDKLEVCTELVAKKRKVTYNPGA